MRHLRIASTVVIATSLLLFACNGPEARKAKFYSKGKVLYEKGDLMRARLELKNAVQLDPRFSEGYRLLGLVEQKSGHFNAAFAAFSRAVEIAPDDLEAQVQLGKLLLMQGLLDRARQKAELVLKAHPEDEEALLLQGTLFLASREPDRALAVARQMIQRGTARCDPYLLLAMAQRLSGHQGDAEKTLRGGVARLGPSLPLHRALADLYAEKGDGDAAAAQLKEMIRLDPTSHRYSITLAGLYWQMGRETEARTVLQTLLKSRGKGETIYLDLADFYGKRDLYGDAEQVLQQGLSLNQGSDRLHLALSQLYVQSGRAESGAALLKRWLAREKDGSKPQAIAVKNALAAIELARGDLTQAGRLVDEVARDNPHDLDASLIKGRLALLQGNGAGAVSAFRTLVTEKPNQIEGYFLLAEALMLNTDMDLALETLRQAQRLEPKSREVRLALARYFVRKQDFAAAEEELRGALAANGRDPAVLSGMGDLFKAAHDPRQAERFYGELARTGPGAALGRLKLSDLYAAGGETGRAADELAKAVAAAPRSDTLFNRLIQLYLRQGRVSEAAAVCRKRIAGNSRDVTAHLALGKVLAQQGSYDGAEQAILQAQRITGSSTRTSLALAQLRLQAGEPNQARKLFEEVLARDPDSLEAANDLACLLADSGSGKDLGRALKLAGQVTAQRPQDPMLMDTLGWVHYRRGEYREAARLLQQAAAKLPSMPVVRYHAGMALYRSGERRLAREHLTAAAKSPASFSGKREALETLNSL